MRRRALIAGLAGAVVWPRYARSQQQRRVYRLGVLSAGQAPTSDHPLWAAFERGLHEFGYVEGTNLQRAFQATLSRIMAFNVMMIFRITATMATFAFFPAAARR